MKKLTLYTTIFVVALILGFACKKEKPEIGGFSPCECESPVSADFDISEWIVATQAWGELYVETDHVFGGQVKFEAQETNANYQWLIGSNTFSTNSVTQFFGNEWINYNIPITLIINKEPNTRCFPNDDGVDTVTRVMTIQSLEYDDYPMHGVFRLADVGTTDSFDMQIQLYAGEFWGKANFINFDGSGLTCMDCDFSSGYRGLRAKGQLSCNFLDIFIRMPYSQNGLVEVDMNYRPDLNEPFVHVDRKLRGRKL